MKKRLIFVGPPGVGKGSEAKIFHESLKIPHISTGDMFRMHFKNNTKLGQLAKGYTDQGLLVPDSVTNDMIKERFEQTDVLQGFILDGYPRNESQAIYFDQLLKDKGWQVDVVVNFYAPDDVLIKRLSGRRTCPVCGAIYHIDNNPPQVADKCDKDGATLTQRADDKEEVVADRLAVYMKETHPLIAYYEAQNVLVHVDGNRPMTDVSADIEKILGE